MDRRLGADHPHQPGRRPLHRPGRAGRGHPGRAWRPRRPATTTPPPSSSAGPPSWPPRPATRTPRPQLKKVVDIDDADHRHRAAEARRVQARRDGARHQLHQDHPGPADAVTATCPHGHASSTDDFCDVCGAPIGRRAPGGCRRVGARAVGGPARCAAGARPSAGAAVRHRHRRPAAGGDARSRARTARPTTPPTRCSARTAATTSPPASCPRRRSRSTRSRAGRVRGCRIVRDPAAAAPAHRPRPGHLGGRGVGRPGTGSPTSRPRAPAPTSGAPTVVRCRRTALIGRQSASRGITPEIDCTADGAISHRHAELTPER